MNPPLKFLKRVVSRDPDRWKRAFSNAAKVVFGGTIAGVAFNFLRGFDFSTYTNQGTVVAALFASVGILILIYCLAWFLYGIGANTPEDVVKLSEEERAAIAERVVEELEKPEE